MSRIRIKFLDDLRFSETTVISNVLQVCPDIVINNIVLARSHATITVANHEQILQLLTPTATDSFLQLKLKPVPPPDCLHNKSIFVNKLSPFVFDFGHELILENLNNSNPVSAYKVFIIHPKSGKSPSSIKVVFNTESDANFVLSNGLRLFDLSINTDQLNREPYVKILQCFKCFSYSHTAFTCKTPSAKCNICSSNHNFRHCPNSDSPKCANCDGNHNSTSYSCPVRKLQVSNAISKTVPLITASESFPPLKSKTGLADNDPQPSTTSTGTVSYAQVASTSSPTIPPPVSHQPSTSSDRSLKLTTLSRSNKLIPRPCLLKQIQSSPSPTPSSLNHPPIPPTPSHSESTPSSSISPSDNQFKQHEWEIKLDLWKTISSKVAGTDNTKFADMLNLFLTNHNLSPLDFSPIFQIAETPSNHHVPESPPDIPLTTNTVSTQTLISKIPLPIPHPRASPVPSPQPVPSYPSDPSPQPSTPHPSDPSPQPSTPHPSDSSPQSVTEYPSSPAPQSDLPQAQPPSPTVQHIHDISLDDHPITLSTLQSLELDPSQDITQIEPLISRLEPLPSSQSLELKLSQFDATLSKLVSHQRRRANFAKSLHYPPQYHYTSHSNTTSEPDLQSTANTSTYTEGAIPPPYEYDYTQKQNRYDLRRNNVT